MKVTVCELPNDQSQFPAAWERLAEHVARERSELVLLPEMPFYHWLAQEKEANARELDRGGRGSRVLDRPFRGFGSGAGAQHPPGHPPGDRPQRRLSLGQPQGPARGS